MRANGASAQTSAASRSSSTTSGSKDCVTGIPRASSSFILRMFPRSAVARPLYSHRGKAAAVALLRRLKRRGTDRTCSMEFLVLRTGRPMLDSDGSIYVEYEQRAIPYPPTGISATLSLLKIATGTVSNINPPAASQPYQAAYVSGGAVVAAYPMPNAPASLTLGPDNLPINPVLVLGENGTAFASYGSNVTSFQLPSGSPNWNYQAPPQNGLSAIASGADNSFAMKNTDTSGLDTVIRVDANGVATPDGWSGLEISNYGGSLWMGLSRAGISGFSNNPLQLSVSPWYGPDGNGGHTSIQNVSVPDFAQSGANQTAIAGVLQKILNALPNNPVCSNWLQAGGDSQGTGAQQIQVLLGANNFGHGTIHQGNGIAYEIGAFSGNFNPDKTKIPGVPLSAVFTVNDAGSFFNQYAGGDQTKPFEVGRRAYSGNTLRAQAAILIHETAHQITVAGFQPDFGNRKAGRANDVAVDKNCRQLIEGLQ